MAESPILFPWVHIRQDARMTNQVPSQGAIQYSLAQNAMDSVARAIELLAWHDISDESSRLKQAVLSIAHATELLLKERLRQVHPSLVWEDVDKYPKLDARTVGVDKAIHRLKHIGAVHLDPVDAEIVKSLRTTRNAIEHFGWQTTRAEANAIAGQGLSFAIQFASQHLGLDIGYRFRDDDTWTRLIEQHRAFAAAHAERVSRALTATGAKVEQCSFCSAMARNIATGACELCGHWEPIRQWSEDDPF